MLQRLFLIVVFSPAGFAFAMDFYVDSKGGKDGQAGTNARTAWKSLEKVNAVKLQPGDRVLFRCGCDWSGTLQTKSGTPSNPITYASYGKGDKPSFGNSVSLNKPNFWINEGNDLWGTKETSSVISKTSRPAVGAKVESYQRKELKGRSEKFAQDGLQGMRFICTETGTAFYHRQIFLVPLTVEQGKRYLFRFKARSSVPATLKAAHFSIDTAAAPYTGIGKAEDVLCEFKPAWNEYDVLLQCQKTEPSARMTVQLGGAVPNGGVFELVPIGFGEIETESLGLEQGVANLVFNRKECGRLKKEPESLREQGDFFFDRKKSRILLYSKRNPAILYNRIEAIRSSGPAIAVSEQKHVVIDGLDLRDSGGPGIQGDDVNDMTVRNCDFSWLGCGIELGGNAENVTVESCRIGNMSGIGIGMVGTAWHRKKFMSFRGNTIWNCDVSIGSYPETKIESLLLEGNTCFHAGSDSSSQRQDRVGGVHFLFAGLSDESKDFVIRENRLSTALGPLIDVGCETPSDAAKVMRSDKNIYWQPDKKTLFSFGETKYTEDRFAEYQKTTGLDADSHVKEVEFAAPSF